MKHIIQRINGVWNLMCQIEDNSDEEVYRDSTIALGLYMMQSTMSSPRFITPLLKQVMVTYKHQTRIGRYAATQMLMAC
jgi:hypothetical protein